MSNQGIEFKYELSFRRNDAKTLDLPNLKSNSLTLQSITVDSTNKAFDLKLTGNGKNIITYGEAVFYQKKTFDLSDQTSQIVNSDALQIYIKNMSKGKEVVKCTLILNYVQTEGNIIYNNSYTNLNEEGLANVLSDIRHAGRATKIIFMSPQKLATIELTPQFTSNPQWLTTQKLVPDQNNQVIIDLNSEEQDFDVEFVDQLKYYDLSLPDNIETLCLVVYGFPGKRGN